MVTEGATTWAITTDTKAWIQSGRATNSPSSPRAGASVKRGLTRWRYWDGPSHDVEGFEASDPSKRTGNSGQWDFVSPEVFEQLEQDFAFSRDEVTQSKASYVEGEISVTCP